MVKVWKHLIAIDNLELVLEQVDEIGVKGKLRACYEGDGKQWKTLDFEFGTVSAKHHQLPWHGKVGFRGCLFSGYNVMRLEEIDSKRTRPIHSEKLGSGLPYNP